MPPPRLQWPSRRFQIRSVDIEPVRCSFVALFKIQGQEGSMSARNGCTRRDETRRAVDIPPWSIPAAPVPLSAYYSLPSFVSWVLYRKPEQCRALCGVPRCELLLRVRATRSGASSARRERTKPPTRRLEVFVGPSTVPRMEHTHRDQFSSVRSGDTSLRWSSCFPLLLLRDARLARFWPVLSYFCLDEASGLTGFKN